MPKPTTSSAKNAPLRKMGHTTTRAHGDNPAAKGTRRSPSEISPQG